MQARQSGERIDEILREAIAEILVVRIRAPVHERHHGEGHIGHRAPLRRTLLLAQGLHEVHRRVESVDRVASEGLLHGSGHGLWDSVTQSRHVSRRLHEALGDHRLDRGTGEGLFPHQHLVQHTGEGEDVAPAVDLFAGCLLRTLVGRRANADPGLRHRIAVNPAQGLADPEIRHERMPLLQHDVLGLDIPVHDPVPVRVIQGIGDLGGDTDRFIYGEHADLVEPIAQGLPFYIGHHVEQGPVGLARIEEGKDVGMIQVGGKADLAKETGGAQGFRDIGAQDLHRDLTIMPYIVRQVDGGHAAGTEFTLDPIAVSQRRLEAFEATGHGAPLVGRGLIWNTDTQSATGRSRILFASWRTRTSLTITSGICVPT